MSKISWQKKYKNERHNADIAIQENQRLGGVIRDKELRIAELEKMLTELVFNEQSYTETNPNDTGKHCKFCGARTPSHRIPEIKHTDECLISRVFALLAQRDEIDNR